jgi:hypothetical protein
VFSPMTGKGSEDTVVGTGSMDTVNAPKPGKRESPQENVLDSPFQFTNSKCKPNHSPTHRKPV